MLTTLLTSITYIRVPGQHKTLKLSFKPRASTQTVVTPPQVKQSPMGAKLTTLLVHLFVKPRGPSLQVLFIKVWASQRFMCLLCVGFIQSQSAYVFLF